MAKAMNVRQYFEKAFPLYVFESECKADDLESMPLDSVCGRACKEAIDAAKILHGKAFEAGGHDLPWAENVIDITVDVCLTFICG